MTSLAFVDTETTGLDPERHEVWEVGLLLADSNDLDTPIECEWMLPVRANRGDPIGMQIGGFHHRHPMGNNYDVEQKSGVNLSARQWFAERFAHFTHGAHLVGAVPSFDEERLRRLLLAEGVQPSWHYHVVDVEAMAVGWLQGEQAGWSTLRSNLEFETVHGTKAWELVPADARFSHTERLAEPPWRSDDLSRACGVEPPSDDERHTALGDARWAYRWYQALVGKAGDAR